jgi:hypothetical protein
VTSSLSDKYARFIQNNIASDGLTKIPEQKKDR